MSNHVTLLCMLIAQSVLMDDMGIEEVHLTYYFEIHLPMTIIPSSILFQGIYVPGELSKYCSSQVLLRSCYE